MYFYCNGNHTDDSPIQHCWGSATQAVIPEGLTACVGDFGHAEETGEAGPAPERSWCASIAQLSCGHLQHAWALPRTPSPIHAGVGREKIKASSTSFRELLRALRRPSTKKPGRLALGAGRLRCGCGTLHTMPAAQRCSRAEPSGEQGCVTSLSGANPVASVNWDLAKTSRTCACWARWGIQHFSFRDLNLPCCVLGSVSSKEQKIRSFLWW